MLCPFLPLKASKGRAANGFSMAYNRIRPERPSQLSVEAHTRDPALRTLRQEDSCSEAPRLHSKSLSPPKFTKSRQHKVKTTLTWWVLGTWEGKDFPPHSYCCEHSSLTAQRRGTSSLAVGSHSRPLLEPAQSRVLTPKPGGQVHTEAPLRLLAKAGWCHREPDMAGLVKSREQAMFRLESR